MSILESQIEHAPKLVFFFGDFPPCLTSSDCILPFKICQHMSSVDELSRVGVATGYLLSVYDGIPLRGKWSVPYAIFSCWGLNNKPHLVYGPWEPTKPVVFRGNKPYSLGPKTVAVQKMKPAKLMKGGSQRFGLGGSCG